MPPLDALAGRTTRDMVLNFVFRGKGPTDYRSLSLVVALIRTVDKAIIEYELARVALEDATSQPSNRLTPYLRAADHMENCISSTKRAIGVAERIKNDKSGPRVSKNDLPRPAEQKQIIALRDIIEHIESVLYSDELVEEDTAMLALFEDQLALGPHRVTYKWLATVLHRLHRLAVAVADADAPPGEGMPSPS